MTESPHSKDLGSDLTSRILVQAALCTLVFLSTRHESWPGARSVKIVDFVDADGGSDTFRRIQRHKHLHWVWMPDDPTSRIEDIIHYLLAYFGPDGIETRKEQAA